MMPIGIFSSYATLENRVTAAIMSVLRSLPISHSQILLESLLDESTFPLVQFQDQPSAGGDGVPDAQIIASLCLLIETKVRPNAVNREQLERHLKRLDGSQEARRVLLVLTPDQEQPPMLAEINDQRLVWSSFKALDQAIDDLLGDKGEVVSDREEFLLRELQSMMTDAGLTEQPDVLLVAARRAWPEYHKYHAYVCQPNRPFKPATHMAFYTNGAIQRIVPKILRVVEAIAFTPDGTDVELGALFGRMLADPENTRVKDELQKVFLLSGSDDPLTVGLSREIPNDKVDKSGAPVAFTMGHRNIALARLKTASYTSDVERSAGDQLNHIRRTGMS